MVAAQRFTLFPRGGTNQSKKATATTERIEASITIGLRYARGMVSTTKSIVKVQQCAGYFARYNWTDLGLIDPWVLSRVQIKGDKL